MILYLSLDFLFLFLFIINDFFLWLLTYIIFYLFDYIYAQNF